MKMRKKISWLLSFFMVFSLFMGSAGMIVKADGQKAVVRIARQDSTATGLTPLMTCFFVCINYFLNLSIL